MINTLLVLEKGVYYEYVWNPKFIMAFYGDLLTALATVFPLFLI